MPHFILKCFKRTTVIIYVETCCSIRQIEAILPSNAAVFRIILNSFIHITDKKRNMKLKGRVEIQSLSVRW